MLSVGSICCFRALDARERRAHLLHRRPRRSASSTSVRLRAPKVGWAAGTAAARGAAVVAAQVMVMAVASCCERWRMLHRDPPWRRARVVREVKLPPSVGTAKAVGGAGAEEAAAAAVAAACCATTLHRVPPCGSPRQVAAPEPERTSACRTSRAGAGAHCVRRSCVPLPRPRSTAELLRAGRPWFSNMLSHDLHHYYHPGFAVE